MVSNKLFSRVLESFRIRTGSRGTWPSPTIMLLFTVSCYVVLLAPTAEANACLGCYNGGQMFLPNSIFGNCRCLCQGNYVGPQCEFFGKRSGNSVIPEARDGLSRGNDDLDLADAEEDVPIPVLADTRLESRLDLLKKMWHRLRPSAVALKQGNAGNTGLESGTASKRSGSGSKYDLQSDWL